MRPFDEAAAYAHINHPNNPYHDPDPRGLCPGCVTPLAAARRLDLSAKTVYRYLARRGMPIPAGIYLAIKQRKADL